MDWLLIYSTLLQNYNFDIEKVSQLYLYQVYFYLDAERRVEKGPKKKPSVTHKDAVKAMREFKKKKGIT